LSWKRLKKRDRKRHKEKNEDSSLKKNKPVERLKEYLGRKE
jgi:hypothetical protein